MRTTLNGEGPPAIRRWHSLPLRATTDQDSAAEVQAYAYAAWRAGSALGEEATGDQRVAAEGDDDSHRRRHSPERVAMFTWLCHIGTTSSTNRACVFIQPQPPSGGIRAHNGSASWRTTVSCCLSR